MPAHPMVLSPPFTLTRCPVTNEDDCCGRTEKTLRAERDHLKLGREPQRGKVRSKGTHASCQARCFERGWAVVGATYPATPSALSGLPAERCEQGLNSDL